MHRMLSIMAAGVMLLCSLCPAYTREEAVLLKSMAEGKLVRLHVIAASDSPEDQRIKLKVRDAILEKFSAPLSQPDSPQALLALVDRQLGELEETAAAVLRAEGYAGPVHAETGVFPFPDKTYGRVLVPAGDYPALRIVIGEGKGQNWWCVLYPALCLATAGSGGGEEEPFTWVLPQIFAQWLAWGA